MRRLRQFTIRSLMILTAIVALCLAFPTIATLVVVHVSLVLAFLFAFFVFLAGPLIMLEWLEPEAREFERNVPPTGSALDESRK